jgi:hypothetical protein
MHPLLLDPRALYTPCAAIKGFEVQQMMCSALVRVLYRYFERKTDFNEDHLNFAAC